MPRKKLIYTHLFPYHVCARSNNKDWFYLSKSQIWDIFKSKINQVIEDYKLTVHAFVLMDNHYHMIVTTNEDHTLDKVMCVFQTSISRTVNHISGRTNHVFGGPYKGSLIKSEEHYFNIYKYVYRNPIQAGLVLDVKDYKYSTYNFASGVKMTSPNNGIDGLIPYNDLQSWINTPFEGELYQSINKGLHKTDFKYVTSRGY